MIHSDKITVGGFVGMPDPTRPGRTRLWRITGVYLGALGQEDIVGLETLDRIPSDKEIMVPMHLFLYSSAEIV